MTIRCSSARRGTAADRRAVATGPEWARRNGAEGARAPASLGFAACYAYSPRGHGVASTGSRLLRARLKSADPDWMACYAARVREQSRDHQPLAGLFGREVILVPIPARAPEPHSGPWAAARLARALRDAGLGSAVWTGLRRVEVMRKSATAPCRERPSVPEHYRSLAVEGCLIAPARLVLVDDVVTKGRTLLAGAMRLREAFPTAEIRAFALLRTLGRVPDIARLLEPCQGTIRWEAEDACREP